MQGNVTTSAPNSRVLSIDVLRGITIALMILVNDPGDWAHVYSQLDHAEWNGSHIAFDIAQAGGDTQLTFTHEGLTPDVACYDNCAPAWEFYIAQSLRNFISTGVGARNETENA